jgi:hypothetical protein
MFRGRVFAGKSTGGAVQSGSGRFIYETILILEN